MVNWKNRVSLTPNRKKITFEGSNEVKYATIEFADDSTEKGTSIDRMSMMDSQGFSGANTVFNADGSILETFDNGNSMLTEFLVNGNIKETLIDLKGDKTIKTTIFNSDGSIDEVMS